MLSVPVQTLLSVPVLSVPVLSVPVLSVPVQTLPSVPVPPVQTLPSVPVLSVPVQTLPSVPVPPVRARLVRPLRPVPSARSVPAPPSPILPGPAPERQVLLPNVLIPGVSHAGAARLAGDLGRHPEVCLPTVKRIGHFAPLRYGRPVHTPLDEYDRHFARWSGQQYRLEAGPDYFDGGTAMVRRVADSLPQARVVLVLRDPTSRLWASYNDKITRGRVPSAMGFESYVDRCLALRANGVDRFEGNRHFRTLSSGFYVEYLPAWVEAFGRRARVVFTEDLQADPVAQVGALFEWLGLDPDAVPRSDDDEPLADGYPGADRHAVGQGRWWWPLAHRRIPPAIAERRATGRIPRQFERTFADVRALYADANHQLAGLLRDRGYHDLPAWLRAD